jgi:hypothetical protein
MTTPYGTFTAYGVQSGTQNGGAQQLGPILYPFSQQSSLSSHNFGSGGGLSLSVPSSPVPLGLWIIPNAGFTGSVEIGEGAADLFISPLYPTFVCFDPANLPSAIAISVTGGSDSTLTFQFV